MFFLSEFPLPPSVAAPRDRERGRSQSPPSPPRTGGAASSSQNGCPPTVSLPELPRAPLDSDAGSAPTEPSPHYFVPFDLFEDQGPIAEADEEEDQEPIAEAPQAAQAPAAAEAAAKAKAAALAAARARFNQKKQPQCAIERGESGGLEHFIYFP